MDIVNCPEESVLTVIPSNPATFTVAPSSGCPVAESVTVPEMEPV